MNFKDLQNYTLEIIYRCRLATPETDEQVEWYNKGVEADTFKLTIPTLNFLNDQKKIGSAHRAIIETVCKNYQIDEENIKMHTRRRRIVEARQIAMHLLWTNTKHSLSEIGWMMGRFDHTTVLHASKTVQNLAETNKQYAANLREIKASIGCL